MSSHPTPVTPAAGDGLEGLNPVAVAALRQTLRQEKDELVARFNAARPTASAATQLLHALARAVDRILQELWSRCAMPKGAALVAVGGYGRGELFPYSDVDVLVLLPTSPSVAGDDTLAPVVERFIATCWDLGLDIGSSVRTVAECAEEAHQDVTIQTSLLEARFLSGSRARFDELQQEMLRQLNPVTFMRAKTLEMRQRHQRYEDTPYALEPNCKESPGGLRDLQVVLWVARAAGLGKTWRELAARGVLTPFEAQRLHVNEGLLKLIRAKLHVAAGRREDRLVFDLQTAVAESFGYQSTSVQRASEMLMRRYYWAAKAVTQLNQILMLNVQSQIEGSSDAPARIVNERFQERAGFLDIRDPQLYRREPRAILETFLLYEQTGMQGLSARTLRALYNARRLMNAQFRRDPANRALFMQILQQPEGQTRAFRLMNQTSVLGRYLWVFRRIVGRMQHDLFHVYTVDQHILMVLRNVRRYFIPEHAHEYPLCTELASRWDKPWILYVAALFHDVAKGRGGDHSALGAVEVRRFCHDHGVAREDAQLVEFLVREHLTMSHVAQKEDLSDPDVIEAFARRMGSERRLTALYLLTVADIRGTSPKVWNAWKSKLLEDLFRLTLRALGGARPNQAAEIEALKAQARGALALYSLPEGVETALWQTVGLGYFARHDPKELAWHVRVLSPHVHGTAPVVRARVSPIGEGLQVLVYTPDQPDLFARICGYFDGMGYDIQDARVHTTTSGYALDTFQVTAPPHLDMHHRDLMSLIESGLTHTIAEAAPLPAPTQGRSSRRVRSFPISPRVQLRPDERGQRWILSISSSDRTGLLYSVARVLARHHVNIQLAKIATLGERVEDTFLVDSPELPHDRSRIQIENELLDVLNV